MPFNSASYLLFLPAVLLLFLVVPDRLRWLLLLAASFVFYGFLLQPQLLAAIAAVILFSFVIGKLIARATLPARRRRLLQIGVCGNVGLLIGLKYLPFLAENLNFLLRFLPVGIIILPIPASLVSVGVSFYAFQAISYLADLYFGTAEPELHLGYFALYLSFFPKLLTGPIERCGDLLPQLKKRFAFDGDNLRSGMLLFAWGLYKKVAVADRLAQFADPVFADVHAHGGLTLVFAGYAYAIQLYCDFSGYTDMALGSARLFNIELTQNFNAPFLARSIADFWRRWHISLSRWILDYLFEPLQMKFRNLGRWGTVCALLTTFVLVGVWHGASWNFVLFGAIHGVYLAAAILTRPARKKIHKALQIGDHPLVAVWQTIVTFHLACIPWVFFRAATVDDALYFLTHLFSAAKGAATLFPAGDHAELSRALEATCVLPLIYFARRHVASFADFAAKPLWFRLAVYYGVIVLLAVYRVADGPQFIYLNF